MKTVIVMLYMGSQCNHVLKHLRLHREKRIDLLVAKRIPDEISFTILCSAEEGIHSEYN